MDTRKNGRGQRQNYKQNVRWIQAVWTDGKGEKTGKALGKHVIKLYSNGISRLLKIKDVKKLRQVIEDDPIIKDQMAGRGCLLVCTFGNYLALVLIAAHAANKALIALRISIRVMKVVELKRWPYTVAGKLIL